MYTTERPSLMALRVAANASRRQDKERESVRLLSDTPIEPEDGVDDRLRLIFTCCHPALSPPSRVALALRTLGGLTTPEIARAFLVPEATMGQRISRAKKKIATARIPYRVPPDHDLPDRLSAVLAVVYLIFTTGHHAPSGRLDARIDLADEALRLGRMLVDLMPDEPECCGLLALMLATHARRDTRINLQGDLILLEDQDRTKWDQAGIDEAAALVDQAVARVLPGPYVLQAAIARLHAIAETYEATDWPAITMLYRTLERTHPTVVVRVNRSVAEAMTYGPEAGLSLLDEVQGSDRWYLLWSARADLLRRLGRTRDAAEAYHRALECDMNDSDRRFLSARLEEVLG